MTGVNSSMSRIMSGFDKPLQDSVALGAHVPSAWDRMGETNATELVGNSRYRINDASEANPGY
jgi:hypothetical protein